jgi:hypothetical protein
MKGTRCTIRPEINATSRDRRQSFATTTGVFVFRAIARFAAAEGCEVIADFMEVETGKGTDALDRRPKAGRGAGEGEHLAAEARWLSIAHSHELQRRLPAMLGGKASITQVARAFDPEVVAIINSAFGAVFADLRLSDGDEALAIRVARRIIELAFTGERDPERLRAITLSWVME